MSHDMSPHSTDGSLAQINQTQSTNVPVVTTTDSNPTKSSDTVQSMNIFTNNTKEVEENILNAEKPENKRKIQNDRNERSAKIRGVEPNHLQVEIENVVQHLKKVVSTAVDDLQDESHPWTDE